MKKLVLFGVVAAVTFAGLFIAAGVLVDVVSQRAITYIKAEGPKHGVTVRAIRYEDSFFTLPSTIYWRGVEATVRADRQPYLPPDEDIELRVEKIAFKMENLTEHAFRLLLTEMMVNLPGRGDGGSRPHNLVKGREAQVRFTLDSLSPREITRQAGEVAADLKGLLLTGRSPLPISFSGIVSFPVEGRVLRARIRVEHGEEGSRLMMDEEDVILVSRRFALRKPLTEAEVTLVSHHPLRAHRLFEIRTYARGRSGKAHTQDNAVPEDAYRHVLWSYLLTKEYGEDFAKQVTDAHEAGRTGNTPEERRMDLKNNMIGIEYARLGRAEGELKALVMNDARVVRKAGAGP